MKVLILTLMIAACISVALAKRTQEKAGFIALVERSIYTDANTKVYFSRFVREEAGEIELALVNNKTGETVAFDTYDVPAGVMSTALSFYIPNIKQYEDYRFKIKGRFGSSYRLSGEVKVNIQSRDSKIIFIQTDKPFYKPGQTVMFRVLPLCRLLRPLNKNTLFDVWVTQPTQARVYQQKNVRVGKGIVQFELPLSEEPVMGFWTINVNVSGTLQTQSFEVKEYVLPKYEVSIQIPPYVLSTDKLIPISVCANYTYGKKVDGILQLNISKQSYYYYRRSDQDKTPTIRKKLDIRGCLNYVINVSLIDDSCCQNIQISAEVFEKGTGISMTASKSVSRNQNPLNLNFKTSSDDYIKPGIPYYGELKVTRPDDTPAANEPISICVTVSRERQVDDWLATQKKKFCSNFTSTSDGKIRYTIPPRTTDITGISLEAKSLAYGVDKNNNNNQPTVYQPTAYGSLKPFYSPSASYIQIQGIEKSLPCNSKQTISVLYTCEEKETCILYYQIVGPNKVFKKRSILASCGEYENPDQYYYPNDVINGANVTQIVPSPGGQARQEKKGRRDCFGDSEYLSYVNGQDITISVTPSLSPSFTFLTYYVRPDGEVVADSKQFKVDKCLSNEVTMKFGDKSRQPGTDTTLSLTASPNSLCGVRVVDKSVVLMDSSGPLTLDDVFNRLQNYRQTYPENHCSGDGRKQPGLPAALSKRFLPPFPVEYQTSPFDDSYSSFEAAGFTVISDLILLTRPCRTEVYDNPRPYPQYAVGGKRPRSRVSAKRVSSAARDSPQANDASSAVSAVDVRSFFPDTWLFEVQTVGSNGELTTYQRLPDTITEWVGSAVCVDRETGLGISNDARIKGFQPFFLSFTLPYSIIRGEKLPVIVSVFSYLQKCLPISINLKKSDDYKLLGGPSSSEVCICPGDSQTLRFYVTSNIIGQLNFTVSAVKSNSDVCGFADIFEGPARDALTNSIVVQPEGFPYEKVLTYFFFPKDKKGGIFTQSIPYDLPEDYVRDSGRGFFSVTGDIMGPAIQNIRNLIRLPTGCGEQNIAKFLPNVYALNYLEGNDELTKEIRDEGVNFLRQGYQSQMKYKRYDNSYSAFGNIDQDGSIFLTAFVVRAFSEAFRYIDIDQEDLKRSVDWIVSKQQKDGCFPEIGQTFSEGIKGGALTNTSSSITAYILMSLLIADSANKTVSSKAEACITAEIEPTPYQNALFAYTFALANNMKKAAYYQNELYATADETGDKTQWYYGPKTVQTQIAAYAVLTNIKLKKPVSASLPIVRYLNTVRNSYGGFSSSQDTVTGLKALSEFAPLIMTNNVNLEISTSGLIEKSYTINRDNRLLLRTERFTNIPGTVDVTASGTGGGLIQATVRGNTNTPFQEKYFVLDIKPDADNKDCEYEDINVCTSYVPSGKRSNMALLEMKMVSGVSPVKETLLKLKDTSSLKMKRFDFSDNTLVLYFDQLTNDRVCFKFTVQRVVNVEDLKPATAKVYDYYAPEYKQEALYSLRECT